MRVEDMCAQDIKLTETDSREASLQNTHSCVLVSGNISPGHLKKDPQKEIIFNLNCGKILWDANDVETNFKPELAAHKLSSSSSQV